MRNFAEKIRSLINPKNNNSLIPDNTPFDFVTTRKGILKELVISKQSNSIIGVYCNVFGEGMFLTAVEDIESVTKGEIIVFHQYDMSGRLLPRTRIDLNEIQMVCPFNKTYLSPLFTARQNEKVNKPHNVTGASV
jgi:hypothetical protein